MDQLNQLKEVWNQNKENYVNYLKELVAIDTHTLGHGIEGGLEKEGQDYIVTFLEQMGADKIVKDPIKEEILTQCLSLHKEGNLGHNNENRYNVYGIFKGEGKKDQRGKSLLFNSHIDTMPAGNLAEWKTPPNKPTIIDGKLYGLGAADMKAGLMASILALHLVKETGIKRKGDVIITSVCDEEGGGNGSMVAAMNGIKADGVVNCEGTNHELILAHMGFVFFKVEIEGKANHSGAKKMGVSAIEKAIMYMQALDEMEQKWLLKYQHPLLPSPNLNVGTIHGGTAGSTVSGNCYFECCVHYLPEQMNHEQVVREFKETINSVTEGDIWLKNHKPVISMYQAGGAFYQEEDSFVTTFKNVYQTIKEKPVRITGSPAGCDSRIWKNIAGCKTIQFGPGNLEQCHAPNEYVEVEAYLETILLYAKLILDWSNQQIS